MAEQPPASGTVEFARLEGKIAVLRLIGRCSFQNSAYLEKAVEVCEREIGPCRYVVDLGRCESMDSTFLGALAGIALRQRQQQLGDTIAVNVSPHLRRTMSLVGLTHMLDLRDRLPESEPARDVEVGENDQVELSRAEQVAHVLLAHQHLVELDSGNEVMFENVLKYLEESLDRARADDNQRH